MGARRTICAAFFYRPSAVTEPPSERRNDEADKHFQTGEADSRAGGERCTDELGGNCQGRPPSRQQRAKHRPRPHFVISSRPANVKRVTRYQKERDGGKKKGCGKIIVPTAECGVRSKNRSGLAAGSEPFLRTETGGRYSVAFSCQRSSGVSLKYFACSTSAYRSVMPAM
jgi:hypothetical protein